MSRFWPGSGRVRHGPGLAGRGFRGGSRWVDDGQTFVAFHPGDPEVVYAGMIGNGIPCVFRSTDSGTTWEETPSESAQTGSGALQVSPHTVELFRGTGWGTWVFPPPPGFTCPSTKLVHDQLFGHTAVETSPTLKIEAAAGMSSRFPGVPTCRSGGCSNPWMFHRPDGPMLRAVRTTR